MRMDPGHYTELNVILHHGNFLEVQRDNPSGVHTDPDNILQF